MSDTFEFEDQARVERLVGTLHDPGATPGDVLTVQAGGSVAAAPGGGSATFGEVTLTGPDVTSGQTIPFDTVVADASSFWDAIATEFVVPAGEGGIYLVGLAVNLGAAAMGNVFASVDTSGAAQNLNFGLALDGANDYSGAGCVAMQLADGDSLTGSVSWDGVAASATVITATMWFSRLGDG